MSFPNYLVLLSLIGPACLQNIQVETFLGKILGTTSTTRLGKSFYSFRGIRYAEAPVDELRFKPPVPSGKWSGTYNATEDGPICPQPGFNDPLSEDCLFLNVYTKELPQTGSFPNLPVIVFLHAGGFYSVTGRSNWTGPQYFMDQDVVLVTLNYRLATLGFLSVGEEAPGNNGLKDQVVALRWVKNNIASFGGNPSSVTLYGYSAGAWSITLHMVSPMSKGLFHRAILGSGSALGHFPLPRNQVELAKKQAKIMGCSDKSVREVLGCLKTKSARDLGDSFYQFAEFGFDPILRWTPVIEEDFGQERFLTDDPVKLFKEGKFEKIPVILGVTKNEFDTMAFPLVNNASLLKTLDEDFEKYAPIAFIYERDTEKSKQVSKKVRKFYLGDKPLTNDSFTSLAHIYSDSLVGFPADRTAELLSQVNTRPVYYYEFAYQGRYSHFYLPGSNNTPYGTVHHDDLMYDFYISPLFPFFDRKFPEGRMVDTLTSLWATFAKTGDPTDHRYNRKCGTVKWTSYNLNTKPYLEIGERLVMKENLHGERYNFWRKLYPL